MLVERINAVQYNLTELQKRIDALFVKEKQYQGQYLPSKYTASVRRASMDLTRALAELRKADHE